MKKIFNYIYLPLLLVGFMFAGCERELEEPYDVTGKFFPIFLSNTLGTATKYAPGETVRFELNFAQTNEPIKEIQILQKINKGDSVVVQTIPYKAAYSKIKRADTLLVDYVVPTTLANKDAIRVDARIVNQNGTTKTRSFNFNAAANATTVRINSVTNRTAPTSATNSGNAPGDVVRYDVRVNENGVNTVTATTPATAILYKDLDVLKVYSKIGNAAEVFVRDVALTATGAATTQNVDVTIPTGSEGQNVVFRFESRTKAPVTTASVTSAPLAIVTATPTAAVKTGNITLGGSTDLEAFNLETGINVNKADAVTTKDIAVTSTANGTFKVEALNTTRFIKSTTTVYNAATVNSIRAAYINGSATAANVLTTIDNLLVGDVYLVRLRGGSQYVAMLVTGINRSGSATTATFEYKM